MASALKSYKLRNVTTEETVFLVPTGTTVTVIGLAVANVSGTDTEVSVLLDDTYILKNAMVIKGSAVVPVGGEQKIVVNANSAIKVTATESVDVVCSVLEQS